MYDPLGDALCDSEPDLPCHAVADALRDVECQSGCHSGRHSAGDSGRHSEPDLRPDPHCHAPLHLDRQVPSDAPAQEEIQSPGHEVSQTPIQALIQLPNDIPNQDLNQPADHSGLCSGPGRLLKATGRGHGTREVRAIYEIRGGTGSRIRSQKSVRRLRRFHRLGIRSSLVAAVVSLPPTQRYGPVSCGSGRNVA